MVSGRNFMVHLVLKDPNRILGDEITHVYPCTNVVALDAFKE